MKQTVLLLCILLALGGCRATTQQTVQPSARTEPSAVVQLLQVLAGRPGLAQHDPKDGQPLFQQIPNWDQAAERRCCSVLSRADFIQARCDTDQPLGGRTNRC